MELKNNKLITYLRDSWEELKKVTWPSQKDTIKHTTIVIGFSIAMAIFIAVIDFIFNKLIEFIV